MICSRARSRSRLLGGDGAWRSGDGWGCCRMGVSEWMEDWAGGWDGCRQRLEAGGILGADERRGKRRRVLYRFDT